MCEVENEAARKGPEVTRGSQEPEILPTLNREHALHALIRGEIVAHPDSSKALEYDLEKHAWLFGWRESNGHYMQGVTAPDFIRTHAFGYFIPYLYDKPAIEEDGECEAAD